ncbi:MAG: hypothetical protein ABIP93_18240 [Gemmatimonadaceae bacterium]
MSEHDQMQSAPRAGRRLTLLVVGLLIGLARSASPQTAPDAQWAGWAQCGVNTQGAGYANRQTQTWTIAGRTPTVQGAIRLYPASWSVTGSGSLTRTQGTQALSAQWMANAQSASAPISVVVRASDGRRLIRAGHAQLRQTGGITGSQSQTVNGKTSTSAISREAFEFTFPTVEDSAPSSRISGSSTADVAGSFGVMQPAGARTTAVCAWDFARDGGAAPAPARATP